MIGDQTLDVYNSFEFTTAKKDNIKPLIDKFEAYCSPEKNTTYERYLFNKCIRDGRTFDAF